MSHRGAWWFSFSSVHALKNDAIIISQAKDANIRVEGTCCFFRGAVPGGVCPPLLFPSIPFTLQLLTSLKTFKWSCRLWPHISGHISPETEEAPGIVDAYPNVTDWRALRACPTPPLFRKECRFWKQANKNKYDHQKYLVENFSDRAEMSRINSIFCKCQVED